MLDVLAPRAPSLRSAEAASAGPPVALRVAAVLEAMAPEGSGSVYEVRRHACVCNATSSRHVDGSARVFPTCAYAVLGVSSLGSRVSCPSVLPCNARQVLAGNGQVGGRGGGGRRAEGGGSRGAFLPQGARLWGRVLTTRSYGSERRAAYVLHAYGVRTQPRTLVPRCQSPPQRTAPSAQARATRPCLPPWASPHPLTRAPRPPRLVHPATARPRRRRRGRRVGGRRSSGRRGGRPLAGPGGGPRSAPAGSRGAGGVRGRVRAARVTACACACPCACACAHTRQGCEANGAARLHPLRARAPGRGADPAQL
jgi:hypothetical protein